MFGSRGLDSRKVFGITAGKAHAPSSFMKYIAVLLVAGTVYLVLARPAPVASAAHSRASAAGSDFLKEPLDRTHEVLDQARSRAKDPALE
jgi:hypothetical protein